MSSIFMSSASSSSASFLSSASSAPPQALITVDAVAAAARNATAFKAPALGRAPVSARMVIASRAPKEAKIGAFSVNTIDQVWASVSMKDTAQVAQAIKHSFQLQESKQTELLTKIDMLLAQQFSAAARETATTRVKVCTVAVMSLCAASL